MRGMRWQCSMPVLRVFVALVALSLWVSTATAQVVRPENLGDLKAALLQYKNTSRHEADLAGVAAEATRYLEERVKQGGKLAVVLDIDETALSNWPAIKANDFGLFSGGPCDLERGPCGLTAWASMARAQAIAPTLELYRLARERGGAVFFITGRPEALREATERNLRAAGYDNWAGLILKPNDLRVRSAADFKAPERRKLADQGYAIILNMGDQPSDLAGGHAERTFLLPNPFYRLP